MTDLNAQEHYVFLKLQAFDSSDGCMLIQFL